MLESRDSEGVDENEPLESQEVFTDTTPDPVTLTEVEEIDPHCGVVNDKKFQTAAAEFLEVVDLSSTLSTKSCQELIVDFKKTLAIL